MPTARKRTTRRSGSGPAAAARKQGEASLERLNKSLDVAQKALTDLSKELGRGGRDLVGDLQKRLTDATRDARRLNSTLRRDLGHLGESLVGRGGGSKRATSRKSCGEKEDRGRKEDSQEEDRGRQEDGEEEDHGRKEDREEVDGQEVKRRRGADAPRSGVSRPGASSCAAPPRATALRRRTSETRPGSGRWPRSRSWRDARAPPIGGGD